MKSSPANVIPLKGSAIRRTGAKCLLDRNGKHQFDTCIGEVYGLLDGTVMLDVEIEEKRFVYHPEYKGQRFLEMTSAEARTLGNALLRVANMCEERHKVLDGRAVYQFRHDGARWFVTLDKETMALKPSRFRELTWKHKCHDLDGNEVKRSQRTCGKCKAALGGGARAYVYDRDVYVKKPFAYLTIANVVFCQACVETKRPAEVGA